MVDTMCTLNRMTESEPLEMSDETHGEHIEEIYLMLVNLGIEPFASWLANIWVSPSENRDCWLRGDFDQSDVVQRIRRLPLVSSIINQPAP